MTPVSLEAHFGEIASYVALVIEAGAVLVVSFGAVQAFASVVAGAVRGGASEMQGREIWLRFATWILLGLSPLPPISCARRSLPPGRTSPSSP
jgi:uncharacterized membrane protein